MTAFPQIVGNVQQENILQYKDNIDDLAEKFLLVENFQLSPNYKLIIGMNTHTTSQEKWPSISLVKTDKQTII